MLGMFLGILKGMKPKGKIDIKFRIAVPCYGDRVLPRFGLARDFVFVDVDRGFRTMHSLQRLSWEPLSQPQLVRWLKTAGVSGVLCGGIHPRFQTALYAEGLWVVWGFRGEVAAILQNWIERDIAQETAFSAKGLTKQPMKGDLSFPVLTEKDPEEKDQPPVVDSGNAPDWHNMPVLGPRQDQGGAEVRAEV